MLTTQEDQIHQLVAKVTRLVNNVTIERRNHRQAEVLYGLHSAQRNNARLIHN